MTRGRATSDEWGVTLAPGPLCASVPLGLWAYFNGGKIRRAGLALAASVLLCASAGQALEKDIEALSTRTAAVFGGFLQQSLVQRVCLEYLGDWHEGPQAAEQYRQLCISTSKKLLETENTLLNRLADIEAYEGNDWETRYGATGLWRRLLAQACRAALASAETDFYLALATEQPDRHRLLGDVLARAESTDNRCGPTAESLLLAARAAAALSRARSAARPGALQRINALLDRPDLPASVRIRSVLTDTTLKAPSGADRLCEISDNPTADTESVLAAALLQRRLGKRMAYRRTVGARPEIRQALGIYLLSEMSAAPIRQINPLDAELAAMAAWRAGPAQYRDTLCTLARRADLEVPAVLYVAAICLAETSPGQACRFALRAARLQQKAQPDWALQIEPPVIARQAGQLACNAYLSGDYDCQAVLEALAYLFENVPAENLQDQAAEDLRYCYIEVLDSCGHTGQAGEILRAMAAENSGPGGHRASLELIRRRLEGPSVHDRVQAIARLDELISQCADAPEVFRGALELYARLLLESRDTGAAEKVLALPWDRIKATCTGQALRCLAMMRSGRLKEAVKGIRVAAGQGRCRVTGEAMEIVGGFLGQVETVRTAEGDAVFDGLLADCRELAATCRRCLTGSGRQLAAIFEAEILLLSDGADDITGAEKLLEGAGLPETTEHKRCTARMLAAQGNFDQAAELWAELAAAVAPSPLIQDREPAWWRARYNQLYCLGRAQGADTAAVAHAIEVLQGSFDTIPAPWDQKLADLAVELKEP